MNIEQDQLDKVEENLNKQNGLLAVFATAFWIIPFIGFWYVIHSYHPNFSPIMLLLSGLLVGLAVRIHGKGMTGIFSLIAVIAHSCIVIVAFSLNIVWTGTTWAFLLFGLYAAGVITAKKIARIEVPFEEHRAYSYLTYPKAHSSSKKLKNTWFVTLPILLVMMAFSSYIAVVSSAFIQQYQFLMNQEKSNQQLSKHIENKEIDILPDALNNRTTHDILLYAYAYHSGLLVNKRSMHSEVFPKSEYKAKTLLKYLIEFRDNARAKFILGFLTVEEKGIALLEESAEQKDKYARIYSAVRFGCYSNENMALELLTKLRDSSSEEYIQEEINSIIYLGITETCRDFERPEFALSFVINYSET